MVDFKKDKLQIRIFKDKETLGKTSALDVAENIKYYLKQKPEIRMVFAAVILVPPTPPAIRF